MLDVIIIRKLFHFLSSKYNTLVSSNGLGNTKSVDDVFLNEGNYVSLFNLFIRIASTYLVK